MVKFLGVDEDVTSPTFSLQQCYGNKIFHYDIYNHGLEHFISLGMLEELEKDGLHFIHLIKIRIFISTTMERISSGTWISQSPPVGFKLYEF